MRALVTGSSGQLGAALARRLARRGAVVGLDRVPGAWTTQIGELGDGAGLARLLDGVDVVFHTASLHARHLASHTKADFIATNVAGTQRLLDAAATRGVGRFIYTSSTSVYGHALEPTDRAVWVTEDLPAHPRGVYDVTKLAAEGLCRLFGAETGTPTVCLRVGRFFPEPPERLAIYRLYRGLDPRDAVRAHLLAASAPAPGFGPYNIAARSPFREEDTPELLRGAAATIARYHPEAAAHFARHGWALPPRIDRVYAIDRAARDLGYRPRHDFAAFLREWGDGPLPAAAAATLP